EDAQRHPTHGGGHGDGDRAERQHEEQDAQADSVQQRAGHLATAARAAWDHLVPLRPSTSSSSPATISPIATTPTTVRVNPVTASGPGDGAESSCPGAAVAGMVTAGDEGTPDNSSSAPPATASRNPRARSRPTAVDCAPQLSVVGARSIVTRTRVACPGASLSGGPTGVPSVRSARRVRGRPAPAPSAPLPGSVRTSTPKALPASSAENRTLVRDSSRSPGDGAVLRRCRVAVVEPPGASTTSSRNRAVGVLEVQCTPSCENSSGLLSARTGGAVASTSPLVTSRMSRSTTGRRRVGVAVTAAIRSAPQSPRPPPGRWASCGTCPG